MPGVKGHHDVVAGRLRGLLDADGAPSTIRSAMEALVPALMSS